MFYFRYYLYKMVKPFMRPIEPDKAIKYHYTALFLYVLISANLAFGAYHYVKKNDLYDEDLIGMDAVKDRVDVYDMNPKKIIRIGFDGIEKEDFNLKEYREQKLNERLMKLEADKKVAMI